MQLGEDIYIFINSWSKRIVFIITNVVKYG